MTPDNKRIAEWAQEERQHDLARIQENLDIFFLAVGTAYWEAGRGTIFVDTTQIPVEGLGHPFGYFTDEQVEEMGHEDAKRLVRDHDPHHELVLMLLKTGGRISTYRIRTQPPDKERTDLG